MEKDLFTILEEAYINGHDAEINHEGKKKKLPLDKEVKPLYEAYKNLTPQGKVYLQTMPISTQYDAIKFFTDIN